MSRLARSTFDTNYFHIIVQGIAREFIFGSAALKDEYLNDIEKYKDEYHVKILGFCMMDNHAHFLLFTPNVEILGEFMRKVNTRFAQYYNFVNERVGYVFRDRFKSQAIFDDKYLLNCLKYIHFNPQKAAICDDYRKYPYSSFGCYETRRGIVDFKAAGELYDCSPENVAAIHDELTDCDEGCPVWIDCDDNNRKNKEKLVLQILKRCPIPVQYIKADKTLLKSVSAELRAAGLTYAEIGEIVGLNPGTIFNDLKR